MSELTILPLVLLIICLLNLSGCASRIYADQMATQNGFEKHLVKTDPFLFTTYQKITTHQKTKKTTKKTLTVYIEGDGRSLISRSEISPDPTPRNPLALKLALLDPNPNVVYLARPCQYTPHALNPACTREIWSTLRFSEKVISAMNEAVEKLKEVTDSEQIHLVGFSGGAAVAVLIAAKRQDIASLKTVAGDLDHALLSQYHKTTPLKDCLNPKSVAHQIALIPQHHFVGDEDPIVPLFISEGFVAEVAKTGSSLAKRTVLKRTVLKGVSHHEGWEEIWSHLLNPSQNPI